MKSYKLLVPIIMVLAMVGSVYMLYDKRAEVKTEYDNALKNARSYAEEGIDKYAIENYELALKLNPSADVYYELGEYYFNNENYRKSLEIGDLLIKQYSKDPQGYELKLNGFLSKSDYVSCFKLYDEVKKRGISSDFVEKNMEKVKYEYYLSIGFEAISAFSGNYAPVMKENLWGYVTTGGNQSIGTKFSYTGPMFNSLAPVVDEEGYAYFIDESGDKVKNIKGVSKATAVGMLLDNICTVYDGTSWSYYNVDEGLLFGGFDEASAMNNGLAAVEKDGEWSIINGSGEKAINDVYEYVYIDEKGIACRNDRMFVKKNGAFCMIDTTGKQITDETYEDAVLFADTTYAAVKKDGKWGFIDVDGKWFIEPTYDNARSFSNGFAAVEKDGKWGFINSDKKLCIECSFDDAMDFTENGTVFVNDGKKWTLLKLYSYNY